MPNTDAPYGLRPVQYAWGAPYDGRCRPYFVPSSYATALYIGDPVILTGTSNTTAVRGFPPGSLPEVNRAGGTAQLTGVIVGFLPMSGAESTTYGAASTVRIALVADSPHLLCAIQDDASGTLAVTDVGLNAQIVFTTAGSIYTGRSGAELDATTPASTATFPLRIISLYDAPNNEVGTSAQWLVSMNAHTYSTGTLGLAV